MERVQSVLRYRVSGFESATIRSRRKPNLLVILREIARFSDVICWKAMYTYWDFFFFKDRQSSWHVFNAVISENRILSVVMMIITVIKSESPGSRILYS